MTTNMRMVHPVILSPPILCSVQIFQFLKTPTERKNAYAKWLTSKENPRFTRVIVNRLWKRAFGHGLFEPVDNLTDRTEISQPELLSFLEGLMKDLNYDIRAFQNVLLHTNLFRREMHLEDHSAGMKFHFAGPLLKRMSAEQIWDSISTLILPGIDTHAPNKKRTLDRIARTRDIFKSLEGRPIEEVMPKIKKAGDLRRQMRGEQVNYEKQISAAYTSGDNALAGKLTKELKEKVREMEKKNRDLVFVDLKEKYPDSPVMMGGAMMGGMRWLRQQQRQMKGSRRLDLERHQKAWTLKERKLWDDTRAQIPETFS